VKIDKETALSTPPCSLHIEQATWDLPALERQTINKKKYIFLDCSMLNFFSKIIEYKKHFKKLYDLKSYI
jgi:hypothetical protein